MEDLTKKKQVKGKTKKTTENDIIAEKTEIKKTVKPKNRLILNDNDDLVVRSNVFGGLLFINDKTGTEVTWDNCGETQTLSAKDIRDMKAKQQAFFKEDWITIIDAPSVDLSIYTMKDVYETLQVGKFYKDNDLYESIEEIFSMKAVDIKKCVESMTETSKRSLIICANDKIKNGTLDSISKVKTLEEILGCELASPED